MKTHSNIGAGTISSVIGDLKVSRGNLMMAQEIARYHHERYGGNGYNGLKGQDIPLPARIFTLADIYDALTSKRVYKPALSHAQAVDIITRGDGRTDPADFDPDVLAAFIRQSAGFDSIRHRYKD